MPDQFHQKIRAALDNPILQSVLDKNAQQRQAAQGKATASLPEPWKVMQRKAHNIRAEVIANLDDYLEQFIHQAQANGMIIHHARDAGQAVDLVGKIARQHSARLITKSKTMVSEEIELNHALEADGFRVIETDLGEYIVQLRRERPGHIITPAVHLRREDVGQTFHERLGMPLTDDIPTITDFARRTLRQEFLEADIGISGVNFGVIDQGMLCIITNEGNGRMVTSLPPVHIALMGIERMVRNLDELATMLYVLPRSSTGQTITVYTNLLRGPRRPGEVDGPDERHIILLDNGRKALQSSPLSEALYCVRCGACLNACPVFREIGGHAYVNTHGQGSTYPGPIGSVVSPGMFGQSEFGQLARASSLCGACKEACPVDIDLPKLLLRVRAGKSTGKAEAKPNAPSSLALGLRLYTWAASSPGRFRLAQRAAGILSRLVSPNKDWMRLPDFTGWGYSKDFPHPARRPFRDQWKTGEINHTLQATAGASPAGKSPPSPDPDANHVRRDSDPVARFEQELTTLGGHFILCERKALSEKLLDLLQQLNITSLLSWEENVLPRDLLKAILEAGIQVTHQPDPDVSAGLTGAAAAIAETGTLILPSGRGQPLTASLLPATHIAVLEADFIIPSLREGLQHPVLQSASAIALVSGPSRTADIEMTLTIGVHGPGDVYVLCVRD